MSWRRASSAASGVRAREHRNTFRYNTINSPRCEAYAKPRDRPKGHPMPKPMSSGLTRQQITAKFPAMNWRPMDPALNTSVQAVLRAERIVAQVWRWKWEREGGLGAFDPALVLFDPARVPALAQRADAATEDFHRRTGPGGALRYNTHDGDADHDPHDPADQGVVSVWRVGSNRCHVVRDRWLDSPGRFWCTTDYFAELFEIVVDQLDYWDCGDYGCDGDCDLKCNVNIAQSCSGTTRMMPANRGTLVLLFRCCRECEALAGKIAANTYRTNTKLAEIEAREHLNPAP